MISPAHPTAPEPATNGALRIDVHAAGRATVVTVEGEIDAASVEALRERLLTLADAGRTRVVLDLTAVMFLDSTGLGALVSTRRRLQALGGGLVLACANEIVLRLLRLTSLDKVIRVHATAAEAVAAEFSG